MSDPPKIDVVESQGDHHWFADVSNIGKIGPTPRPLRHRSLVIETERRLVLVDPGLGVFDWLAPSRRLGWTRGRILRRLERTPRLVRPLLERRGISPDHVTDIVLTHAHRHVLGAVSDFPDARLHLLPSEAEAHLFGANARPSPALAHHPEYVAPATAGASWHGFLISRLQIDSLEAYLIELGGHTRDHAGVLLPHGNGFVLYLGDAIETPEELVAPEPLSSWSTLARLWRDEAPFESMVTRERLRCLVRRSPPALTFVFAHGPTACFSVGRRPFPRIGFL